MRLKPKIEIPSGCSTEEFTRFEELVRLLVSVPKKDIKDREKKKDVKNSEFRIRNSE